MEELPPVPPSAPPSPLVPLRTKSGYSDKDDHAIERKTLRDYYIILRERLWIALPVAILVAVGVGYYQMRETPMYQASTTIQWEKMNTVTGGKGITDSSLQNGIDLQNKLAVLRSGVLEEQVRKSLTPGDIQLLQKPFIDAGAKGIVGIPMGSKSIDTQRESTTIAITVRHQGGPAAALLANRYAEEFVTFQREKAATGSGLGISGLKSLLAQQKEETEKAENALRAFQAERKYTPSSSDRETVGKDLARYRGDVNVNEASRKALELTLGDINRLKRESQARMQTELAKLPPRSSDLVVKRLELEEQADKDLLQNSYLASQQPIIRIRTELAENERRYATAGVEWAELHPAMLSLRVAHAALVEQLRTEEAAAIRVLENDIALYTQRQSAAQQMVDTLGKDADRLESLAIPYGSLLTTAETARRAYQGTAARLTEAQAAKDTESIPLQILDRAVIPGAPYTPNLTRVTRTCVGLGLIVFVGLAVGLSFIDDRIKSAWDVEHFIGVDLLGIVPDLSSLKDEEKYTLVLNDSQAPGTESFLSVYSSVKIHSKLDFPKSILITSTIPGEGKTLISCNLAGSFARHGKRTLLIDCDLRRPMLHRHFRRENNKGLITWFEAGAAIEGDLTQDPTLGIIPIGQNFSLLCSGGRSRVPTEILESTQFAALLARLKKMYDLVVIDSPPLGAVTDSLLIAERADEVIYVCRFNRAYKKHIRLHVKALRNGKNELLGVVLNGLSPRRIEYYSNYRYYRSYKKYYGAQT